jgi:hypothetical protein
MEEIAVLSSAVRPQVRPCHAEHVSVSDLRFRNKFGMTEGLSGMTEGLIGMTEGLIGMTEGASGMTEGVDRNERM